MWRTLTNNSKIWGRVHNYEYKIRCRDPEETHASEKPWCLNFVNCTLNPLLPSAHQQTSQVSSIPGCPEDACFGSTSVLSPGAMSKCGPSVHTHKTTVIHRLGIRPGPWNLEQQRRKVEGGPGQSAPSPTFWEWPPPQKPQWQFWPCLPPHPGLCFYRPLPSSPTLAPNTPLRVQVPGPLQESGRFQCHLRVKSCGNCVLHSTLYHIILHYIFWYCLCMYHINLRHTHTHTYVRLCRSELELPLFYFMA